jgi:hypothetical protein
VTSVYQRGQRRRDRRWLRIVWPLIVWPLAVRPNPIPEGESP